MKKLLFSVVLLAAASQSFAICSSSKFVVEDEWKRGKPLGEIHFREYIQAMEGNHACVGFKHKGKTYQYQYRCDLEDGYVFVQRFWTREGGCNNHGKRVKK